MFVEFVVLVDIAMAKSRERGKYTSRNSCLLSKARARKYTSRNSRLILMEVVDVTTGLAAFALVFVFAEISNGRL